MNLYQRIINKIAEDLARKIWDYRGENPNKVRQFGNGTVKTWVSRDKEIEEERERENEAKNNVLPHPIER